MFSRSDIETYFVAERKGALVFLAAGILCLAAAVILFLPGASYYRGIGVPCIVFGLLFTVAGVAVYRRSDGDRIRNVYAYDMNPSELGQKELPRMRIVMKNFILLRYAEIVLFCTGSGLFIFFLANGKPGFWRGFGLGLALMSLIALVGDHYAAARGRRYTEGLASFVKKDRR